MPRIKASQASVNQCAFLDMLAFSELGEDIPKLSDDGYNVIVGSTKTALILFNDYSKHPNKLVKLPKLGIASTAAGRYQLLNRYYAPYATLLGLKDFSPVSQDRIALQQIKERKAIALIDGGLITQAIMQCSNIWASLPGNNYGQHQNSMAKLIAAYKQAGGSFKA